VVHTYSEILFSFKKNETQSHATPWMKVEDIILGEISQSQKDKYYFHMYEVPSVVRFIETGRRKIVGYVEGRRGSYG
jgi:hypothetical protein